VSRPTLLLRGAPLFLAAALLFSPATAGAAKAAPAPFPSAASCEELRENLGIEVVRLFATASGTMLDFRYKVVDSEKAAALFAKGSKTYLVNEVTKQALAIPDSPKTGPLRASGRPEAGRTYFILFSNLDRSVKRGDPVSIVVGDFLIPDLVVE
jgi:hypothetical protein